MINFTTLSRYPLVAACLTGTIVAFFLFSDAFTTFKSNGSLSSSGALTLTGDLKTFTSEDSKFSEGEMKYFETGEGDHTKLSHRLPEYIRKKIVVPRKYKPAHEWPRKDYSQTSCSNVIDELLGHRSNGFFVECGAYDGLKLSNTAFLEFQRNWTGLLMEADPQVSPKLLACGRKTYMLTHCISPVNKPFRAKFRIGGVFSGISELFGQDKMFKKYKQKETTAFVTCFPFNSIMEALGIYHIDYFSLDVEGAEYDVLQTIDLTQFRIDLFHIEYAYAPIGITKEESLVRLNQYRAFFNATGVYKEVGIIKHKNVGMDVLFKRID